MKISFGGLSMFAVLLQILLTARSPGEEPLDFSGLYAKRMETILGNLTETKYQAKTVVDHQKGIFKGNCSGLIGYVLRENFPEAYLSIRGSRAPWRARPLAVTYYETFVSVGEKGHSKPAWQRIRKMMDVKPGDIIAWRKLSLTEGLATGHICVIASKPILEADGRVRVRLIDSTSGRHFKDTRKPGTNGVGAGEMWFAVNEKGEPEGFWLHENSKRSKTNKIAIGRMMPVKETAAIYPKGATPKSERSDTGFLGLGEAEAVELAKARKIKFRVIERDGKIVPVTREINNRRVNFIIRRGKIFRTIRG
jgi:hypothetical protein